MEDHWKAVWCPCLHFTILTPLPQCLLHRALHPQEPLPPIQQHILSMLDPPTEVTAKCQVPLSKIKTLFPLTEVIKKKNQVTGQDIFQDK